jgi:hypothetical protein
MGGEKSNAFARFEVLCSSAYNALRKNANLIINLLVMVVGACTSLIYNRNTSNSMLLKHTICYRESELRTKRYAGSTTYSPRNRESIAKFFTEI